MSRWRVLGAGVLLLPLPLGGIASSPARETPADRGERTFKANCVLCHGDKADGTGIAAKNYNPPPANLTVSWRSDEYKQSLITKGGEAMGRSPYMPPFGQALTEQQIGDLVAYLRTVKGKPQ